MCEPTDDARVALLPERLSETGLYTDIASDRVADGVLAYQPAFALWSDGADKRRWISLPIRCSRRLSPGIPASRRWKPTCAPRKPPSF